MLITVILTAILLIAANVVLYFVIKRRLIAGLHAFFAPRGDNLSEFAEIISVITDQAATKNAQSLKAVFMGQNSVVAKNSGRLETAIATDLVGQQSPLLGMGISMFPNLQKLIIKNPGALQMLATFLQGQGKNGKDQDNPGILPGNDQTETRPDVFSF